MQPFDHIKLSEFNYVLPDDRIAVFPVKERDQSRMLIRHGNGRLTDDVFCNLTSYLPFNSRIFFNNSKVIPARLLFRKDTGSVIEIFCLKPFEPVEYSVSLASAQTCTWECMIGNIRKFKETAVDLPIHIGNQKLTLKASKISSNGNMAVIRFSWDNPGIHFAEILQFAGNTPLPPYIKRDPVEEDKVRYQTIYSSQEGSVAAPTAGLHFSDNVFNRLMEKKITSHEITLHVGAGTFQPIKSSNIADHRMHAEYFEIPQSIINLILNDPTPVISVGTTTVRTLESLYWTGVKILLNPAIDDLPELDQWEAYTLPQDIPVKEAFQSLNEWTKEHETNQVFASTRLMIIPGYKFRMTDTLITNFHQPGSTLLLLIAAFIGDSWKETYQYALDRDFRFLSYGDSSLLFLKDKQ